MTGARECALWCSVIAVSVERLHCGPLKTDRAANKLTIVLPRTSLSLRVLLDILDWRILMPIWHCDWWPLNRYWA
jgi:hypothetical protein